GIAGVQVRPKRLCEAAPQRRPADPGADRAAPAAAARLLGLHARAWAQGFPRSFERRPEDPGSSRQRSRAEQPDLPESAAGLSEVSAVQRRARDRKGRRWLSA